MAKSKKKPAAKPSKKPKAKAKAPAAPKKAAAKPKKAPAKAKPAKKAAPKPKKAAPAPKPVPAAKPVAAPKRSSRKSGGKAAVAEKPSRPDMKPSAENLKLNIFPIVNQRPIAHKPAKPAVEDEGKTRYSDEELKEFEDLINKKLAKAKDEFRILKETLNRNNDEGTDATSGGNTKVLEDGAETAEKENLGQQAARQQKFITNLENALVRIKNGTYGICSVTGKLISKERLIAVPHTTQSIEAKMMNKD